MHLFCFSSTIFSGISTEELAELARNWEQICHSLLCFASSAYNMASLLGIRAFVCTDLVLMLLLL